MRPKMVKICGITQALDAQYCIDQGADALGFIFHPQSPRNLSFKSFLEIKNQINFKGCLKIAVAVAPQPDLVREFISLGFEKFQFHFPVDLPLLQIRKWSDLVGAENLWLAPRMKPVDELPTAFFSEAETFLLDAYSPKSHGGTGEVSDWAKYLKLKKKYTKHRWVLAGGLGPNNLEHALSTNIPDGIDLNSGVEVSPGVKDTDKIDRVFAILKSSK
jgi:phosphoribosylanthranilate isomerase